MQRLLEQFRKSEFLRHNAIVFAGSMAISILNYLYYPVLGRLLDPSAFGEVQAIVSIFLQIAIFLTVLGLITVNIIANKGDDQRAQDTILELEKLALAISLIGLVLVVVCGPLLQRFFQFDSVAPFVLLAVALVISVPVTFRTGYLRGKNLFGGNAFAGLIGAAAKLLLSVLLVYLGFGVSGAIAGLVLAQAISFGYSASRARKAGFGPGLRTGFFKMPDLKLITPELRYAGLVLVGSLAITMQYSIDVIAVKHYFDAHTAGLYAGIATVARIIIFITGSVSLVLPSAIKINNSAMENSQILKKSIILLSGLGGSVLLIFCLLPNTVVKILMGNEYLQYASLLPRLSILIFAVSVLNLFVLYDIALRRYSIGLISVAGLIATCGLVLLYHGSLQSVINSMLAGTIVTAGLLAVWFLLTHRLSARN